MDNDLKEIKLESQNAVIRQFSNPNEDINELTLELVNWIEENNLTPVNHLFARNYLENNEVIYDFGIPIEEEVEGTDEFKFIRIPEQTVLSIKHIGNYDNIDETMIKLSDYLTENNLELIDAPRYIYHNSPDDVNEEDLITEIQYPLKK
ncbi:GyrI-like domain-containing protein [Methanobrevibacter sp. DSM 116169]|uniref:GyrI-like domain-containing protein n=1 Tax=Methanobrevibacter sp. DSM 116169 TaxID=3242727 RepID=UPI0038FD39B0